MQRPCSHSFSWPIRALDGRYYRTCRLCGGQHEFDWKQMRGIDQERAADARPLTLLPARESAVRVFAGNLLFCLQSHPRTVAGYLPGSLWRNVFVPSGAPWHWFGRSLICHAVAIAILVTVFRPSRVTARRPGIFSNSQITYYLKPSTFPAREARPSISLRRPVARTGFKSQAAIRVAPSRKLATIFAPHIKLPRAAGARIAALGNGIVAPAPPSSALSQFHLKAVPPAQVSAVGPAPELHQNLRGSLSLSQGPVIGPPSNLAGLPSQRKVFAQGSTVVAPAPSIQGLRPSANSVTIGNSTVVAPAPQLAAAAAGNPYGKPGAPVLAGSGDVVAPAPQIAGTISARKAGLPQPEIVPPAPGTRDFHPGLGSSAVGNFGVGYVPAVPPAPQISAAAGSPGSSPGIRAGFPGIGSPTASAVAPPPSLQGSGITAGTGTNSGSPGPGLQAAAAPPIQPNVNNSSELKPPGELPAPESVDNSPAGSVQEFSLHLVGVASALPTSSYFSNYEVFIAERRLTKLKSQLIKLVYMFLPYQRRLSEYGTASLGTLKLRVRRDPTCDESLLDITWPDSASRPQSPGPDSAAKAGSSNARLPCYRTSADDYRRAIAKVREQ
jgi:hypothetical protein